MGSGSVESLRPCPSNESILPRTAAHHDDVKEQLRKILTWRHDHVATLSKTTRRTIKAFLGNSQSKMSMDTFEQMLDTLDLKLILVPR